MIAGSELRSHTWGCWGPLGAAGLEPRGRRARPRWVAFCRVRRRLSGGSRSRTRMFLQNANNASDSGEHHVKPRAMHRAPLAKGGATPIPVHKAPRWRVPGRPGGRIHPPPIPGRQPAATRHVRAAPRAQLPTAPASRGLTDLPSPPSQPLARRGRGANSNFGSGFGGGGSRWHHHLAPPGSNGPARRDATREFSREESPGRARDAGKCSPARGHKAALL